MKTTLAYDNLAHRTKVQNDRIASPAGSISKYEYDYTPVLSQRSHVQYTGEAFVSSHYFDWGYNNRGELEKAEQFSGIPNPDPTKFTFNGDFEYIYDEIGNREAFTLDGATNPTSYTANDLNQYDEITHPDTSSDTLVHDDDGNLIDDGVFKYTWDMENRLAAITPKTVEDESIQAAFKYDYKGRRIRKTVEQYDEIADTWDKLTDQLFIYDQWNVLLVLDAENSDSTQHIIERKYTWGLDLSGQSGNFTASGLHGAGGIAGLLAVEEVSGTYAGDSYWYLYDANGNVGQLVKNDTGYPIAARYEYDPYGKIIGPDVDGDGDWKDDASAYALLNPFRFSTKWLDHELAASGQTGAVGEEGMYYYGYRYYSPELGRWINRDPLMERGGANLYVHTLNAPIVFVDPDGRLVWNIVIGIGGAIIEGTLIYLVEGELDAQAWVEIGLAGVSWGTGIPLTARTGVRVANVCRASAKLNVEIRRRERMMSVYARWKEVPRWKLMQVIKNHWVQARAKTVLVATNKELAETAISVGAVAAREGVESFLLEPIWDAATEIKEILTHDFTEVMNMERDIMIENGEIIYDEITEEHYYVYE